jgi:hypothetical protein
VNSIKEALENKVVEELLDDDLQDTRADKEINIDNADNGNEVAEIVKDQLMTKLTNKIMDQELGEEYVPDYSP